MEGACTCARLSVYICVSGRETGGACVCARLKVNICV